ncbi:hypothetical protein B0H14DRAFT_2912878 [Mycena olivaceomarginata]|nr:hypothetical protein B0H14DRAFT_2912878 [Mycena olivaceomarginata]
MPKDRQQQTAPALGSCEIDRTIFDIAAQSPVIPVDTVFLFSNGNPFNLKLDTPLNAARGLQAFRDQSLIETPQYEWLQSSDAELNLPGNCQRYRTLRGVDADADAIYERRHRPFELEEKRESRRHKKHQKRLPLQLRKRVEQLENMSPLAFLGAPAAWFSPAPLDQAKFGSNAEGQRRKTEMLFNASVMKNRCSRYADPPTADHAMRDRRRRKRELMDYVFIPAANPPNTNTPASGLPPCVRDKSKPEKRQRTDCVNNSSQDRLSEEPQSVEHLKPKKFTHSSLLRVAVIGTDGSVIFENSSAASDSTLPRIKWSLDNQVALDLIARQFQDILPGPGFTLPVRSDVFLAFQRIAVQIPWATTAQVLEFHYWRQNPETFEMKRPPA